MDIPHYLVVALGWAFFVFWIWMLVDCLKNEEDQIERVTWALFMFFIAPLFVPIYYFRRYRQRQRNRKRDEKTTAVRHIRMKKFHWLTPQGFLFSVPTALFWVTFSMGHAPFGNDNEAALHVLALILLISLPWSIIGVLIAMIATGCCGPSHPEWWHMPVVILCIAFASLGAHFNGSVFFSLFRRKSKENEQPILQHQKEK